MPTKNNIQHLEALLEATTVMLDMKKAVDRVEQEIRIQKKLLGLIAGEEDGTDGAQGEVGGDTEPGDQNDGDVKEETGQDSVDVDREPSVALADGVAEDVPHQVRLYQSAEFKKAAPNRL